MINDYGMYEWYHHNEAKLYSHVLRQVDAADEQLNQIDVKLLLKKVITFKSPDTFNTIPVTITNLTDRRAAMGKWIRSCTHGKQNRYFGQLGTRFPTGTRHQESSGHRENSDHRESSGEEEKSGRHNSGCPSTLPQFDIVLIFSGYKYPDVEVGWTSVGTVCGYSHGSLASGTAIINGKKSSDDAYRVIAHEVGHMIGILHDDTCPEIPDDGNHIMTPVNDFTQSGWSDCTISQLMRTKVDHTCLSDANTSHESVIDVTTERSAWILIWICGHWLRFLLVFVTILFIAAVWYCYRVNGFQELRNIACRENTVSKTIILHHYEGDIQSREVYEEKSGKGKANMISYYYYTL